MFGRKPKPQPLPAPPSFGGLDPLSLVFRRAVGFTIKVYLDRDAAHAELQVKRHGRTRTLELTQDELRQLMAMHTFAPRAHTPLLERLEAHDLVYYSRVPVDRASTGAPLVDGPASARFVSLRAGVKMTLAVADDEEITPWLFMPRRGSLSDKRLVGARFASLEMGEEAYVLDLLGHAKDGATLRDLLPLLDGRQRYRDLASPQLAWLDAAGFLETHDAPLTRRAPAQFVQWLGHAAVLARAGNATIAIDPLFFSTSDPERPRRDRVPDPRTFSPIDAIAITHGDNDHLNPHSLARFNRNTPVIVPACPDERPYQVDLAAAVRFLGFTDVRELAAWEATKVGDVQVTAVPFDGEDWGLTLPKCTYVVSGPRGAVYLSADSAAMPAVWPELRRRFTLDVAFMGISGCEEPLVAPPRFGYGEFYALWLPHARRNEWQRLCAGPREAADAVRALQPRYYFGYAAGGGTFMDMSHSDRGTHEQLCALLASDDAQPAPLVLGEPFDFLSRSD